MLVEISHGSVSFGAEVILSDINFMIKNTEKIAIVGRNGCGKTTLLNLISGRTELDKMDSAQDVFIARRGGYEYEKEYELIVQKFGFTEEDKQKKLCEFSGGQRTRIAFAKMLLSKPDVLLLDEPTNHLDIATIRWLEQYLKTYDRALVVVSHDRIFLDNVVDVVYEIERKHITMYRGNYSSFVVQKRQNYDKRQKEYEAQQNEIARLEKLIDHFKGHPTKAPMARAKRSQLERMERILPPVRYDLKTFHPEFEPAKESYTDALTVRKLQIGYGKSLAEISLEQKKGEKIGIIGGNGCGKSTFLKTLIGQAEPIRGAFSFGGNVEIGMDILSKEALGNMLKNYTGTVLFVSHDRYFIRQVADTLMVFEDGIVRCGDCFLE